MLIGEPLSGASQAALNFVGQQKGAGGVAQFSRCAKNSELDGYHLALIDSMQMPQTSSENFARKSEHR